MRARLVAGALVAGVAATLAPLTPAAAYCEPEIIVVEGGGGSGGCRNSCVETGERYERLRTEYGLPGPSYWDLFACLM